MVIQDLPVALVDHTALSGVSQAGMAVRFTDLVII
jgi:hypothetical protein